MSNATDFETALIPATGPVLSHREQIAPLARIAQYSDTITDSVRDDILDTATGDQDVDAADPIFVLDLARSEQERSDYARALTARLDAVDAAIDPDDKPAAWDYLRMVTSSDQLTVPTAQVCTSDAVDSQAYPAITVYLAAHGADSAAIRIAA